MKFRQLALVIALGIITPLPASAQELWGSLDAIYGGWALNKANPTASVQVVVFASNNAGMNAQIYDQKTDGTRPDVNAHFRTTGTHGFGLSIPDFVKTATPGSVVTVQAFAVVNGFYYELAHSPRRVTFPPATPAGPRIRAQFVSSLGQPPSDDSVTALYRLNQFGSWDYIVGSDSSSGNGRILDGAMTYWYRRVWPAPPTVAPPDGIPAPFECGNYLLTAIAANGQTAYREFPMCGKDVNLGTIVLNNYPAATTVGHHQIVGGKISYMVMVNNQASVQAEIYTVVSTPTPNANFTTFTTNREDMQAGISTLTYGVNVPKGVPPGFSVYLEIIVTEKGNPFNVLGRANFSVTTQKQ